MTEEYLEAGPVGLGPQKNGPNEDPADFRISRI